MCGLLGFYPKKNKKVDLTKLYPLWILNEDRGVHSCGISYGSQRIAGISKLSKARDLISDIHINLIETDLINKPIICHTRHATNGAHTDANAHPFMWYRGKEDSYFMFAHNGVIKDLYNLKKTLEMSRHKEDMMTIDSHVLGLAVYDSFVDVLSEEEILTQYDGNAAFICYDSNNTFKVWKGANNNIEERPLYYVETKEGWYFSSIKIALKSVFLVDPTTVINNTLMTFKNYKFNDSKVFNRSIKDINASLVGTTTPSTKSTSLTTFNNLVSNDKSSKDSLSIIGNAVKLTLSSIIKPIKNKKTLSDSLISIATYGYNNIKGKYILKENSTPLDGDHNILILGNNAIININGDVYTFNDGVLLKKNYTYDKIQSAFLECLKNNLTFEDTFNSLYTILDNAIVDFIPLYDKNSNLQCIIYKEHDYLEYITGHDKIPTRIPSKLNFTIQAYPANNNLFLNLYDKHTEEYKKSYIHRW